MSLQLSSGDIYDIQHITCVLIILKNSENNGPGEIGLITFNPCANLNSTALPCYSIIKFTQWGRVTHICVGKPIIIGSVNGLSPGRRQAIIWTNAGILLIGPLGTNFSEILTGIQIFPFKKVHLKMSSAKWRPFCLGLKALSKLSCGSNHSWTAGIN